LCRWPASSLLLSGVLSLASPRESPAIAQFAEVTGRVEAGAEGTLLVVLQLKNVGDAKAVPLTVEGELLEQRAEAQIEAGVAAGESGEARLRFALEEAPPGLHALTLLLEYPTSPASAAGSSPPMASQRAYLLLTLGASAEPAVKLTAPELTLETRDALPVGLESTDGAPHRVRLRVLAPRGLNVEEPWVEVEVPARGQVTAPIELLRAGAARGSLEGILIVAATTGEELTRTTVATGVVRIAPDSALLPRLRPILWALAVLLIGGGLLPQVFRPARPVPAQADPP
jgi:hypothetical protein